ncbi:MAG: hypothetical protein ACOC3V_00925 [bacterium]
MNKEIYEEYIHAHSKSQALQFFVERIKVNSPKENHYYINNMIKNSNYKIVEISGNKNEHTDNELDLEKEEKDSYTLLIELIDDTIQIENRLLKPVSGQLLRLTNSYLENIEYIPNNSDIILRTLTATVCASIENNKEEFYKNLKEFKNELNHINDVNKKICEGE